MKRAIATFLISATALGGTLAYAHAQENTTSGSILPTNGAQSAHVGFKKFGDHKPPMRLQNVEESRTNIDNGVKITRTSTDAEVVKKLQEEETNRPKPKNAGFMADVTSTKTNITNGVEITLTSTNADTVKKLQEGPKLRKGHGMFPMEKVNITRENLTNGVKITQTSTDAAVVTKLQSSDNAFPGKHAEEHSDVTATKVNIANGVEITLTSTNADTVTKLQQGPKQMQRGEFSQKGRKASSK